MHTVKGLSILKADDASKGYMDKKPASQGYNLWVLF